MAGIVIRVKNMVAMDEGDGLYITGVARATGMVYSDPDTQWQAVCAVDATAAEINSAIKGAAVAGVLDQMNIVIATEDAKVLIGGAVDL